MTEQSLLYIDINPKPNTSVPVDGGAERPLWTRSDNTFAFNFLPDNCTGTSGASDRPEPAASHVPFTGGDSFSFNFQIPASSSTAIENMETTETPETSSPAVREEPSSPPQEVNSPPPDPAKAKKKKKKKKNGNARSSDDAAEPQQNPGSAEGGPGGEEREMSEEEQLNRQLDWCMEQLELGMRSQKGTPKQKEEASRALKTLRSSKAPLAKKRQVMRAMTGDYRKKMEEERSRQHKLIQGELATAQVKVVPNPPKKCVFHRRAEVSAQTSATDENLHQAGATAATPQTAEETSAFVFVPSNETFRFNFL